MVYIVQQASAGTAPNTGIKVSYDQLATTINFD